MVCVPRRILAAGLIASGLLLGTVTGTRAESVPCGEVNVYDYSPVVTDCYDWGIHHYPKEPVLKDGRWVINDAGLEFTLMFNARRTDAWTKDAAMVFFKKHGVQVRFGVAQPLDGSEPSQEYRETHVGLYVESEYAGDWHAAGLPTGK